MPLTQYQFNPMEEDHDRFIKMFNWRFNTDYDKPSDVVHGYPHAFGGEYPRNSWIQFKQGFQGRTWWYYDRVDIGELLSKFKFPYIYEEVVHFHGGLPHHANEVADWMVDEFGLQMSKHEINTSSRGSGGPFFQYNFHVRNDSLTMTGSKQMYVRNKWKNHFDEHLFIFELPDINSL